MKWLIVLCTLSACAHTPDLPLRADPAPPRGSITFDVTAPDGTKLLAREWKPATEPVAVVVIMHGLKDHSARYADLAARLVSAGHAVYALDLRGHGRSSGPRVAPKSWTDYVGDLDRFLSLVEQRVPNKPVFVLGHSMGGAIAARAAQVHRPTVAGLVLSAPALGIDAPPLLLALTRMAAFANPRAPALKLPNDSFSSTPGATDAMTKDELVSQPPAPASTAAGLVEGMRAVWAGLPALTMPLLALHGTKDKLTPPSGSRALIEHAPATDKTLRIYDGFFHDLLHEPERARVEADVVAWVDAHARGTAMAPTPVYSGALDGDPRGWTQSVELALGISRIEAGEAGAAATRFAGNLAIGLARPRPFGWHGALVARRGLAGYAVALRPLGVAVRAGATMVGVSGGAAVISDVGLSPPFAGAAGAWLEQPLGPTHAALHADFERGFQSGAMNVLRFAATLRIGGDRPYWPHARAGVGPAISGAYECVGDACGWSALLGLQLYGVD